MSEVMVLFEAVLRDGMQDEYLRLAGALKENLAEADGFIRSERFSSLSMVGKILSMSVWRDEAAVRAWKAFPEHARCQAIARDRIFSSYRITATSVERSYTMER